MTVLVAYETVHGSTRSIAENIGRAIAAHAVVTTSPMREVEDLSGFDAFVLGSAEIDGAWLPPACEFLRYHADELTDKPVWLFGVGISDALPRPWRSATRRRDARELQTCAMADINPRGTQVFSGLVPREQTISRTDRRLLPRAWIRHGDFRDWPEIIGWAHEITAALNSPTYRSGGMPTSQKEEFHEYRKS